MSSRTVRAGWVTGLTVCVLLWSLVLGTPFVAVAAGQSSSLPYPEIYRANGLPELPGATVAEVTEVIGRPSVSLRDGRLRLRVRSAMALADVREFYRQALFQQGWTEVVTQAAQANPLAAVITMKKDGLTYTVMIMPSPNSAVRLLMINVGGR